MELRVEKAHAVGQLTKLRMDSEQLVDDLNESKEVKAKLDGQISELKHMVAKYTMGVSRRLGCFALILGYPLAISLFVASAVVVVGLFSGLLLAAAGAGMRFSPRLSARLLPRIFD